MSNLIRGPSRGFLPSFCSFGQAVSEEKRNINLPEMLPTKFLFIWPSGFRGEDFLEIGDQPETRIVCGGHVC
jgi:hypothetical protein